MKNARRNTHRATLSDTVGGWGRCCTLGRENDRIREKITLLGRYLPESKTCRENVISRPLCARWLAENSVSSLRSCEAPSDLEKKAV